MPDLGKKYTCYSCHTKFYDLGKPVPTCPKCGADQRATPSAKPSGSRARAAPPKEVEPEEVAAGDEDEAEAEDEDEAAESDED